MLLGFLRLVLAARLLPAAQFLGELIEQLGLLVPIHRGTLSQLRSLPTSHGALLLLLLFILLLVRHFPLGHLP